MAIIPKPCATARKIEKKDTTRKRASAELDHKKTVRRRDKYCRFPLCGCRRLGLTLIARGEVAHTKHKGAGGNPDGDRSAADIMVLLCKHRHQDGIVSMHKGTLKAVYLTEKKMAGPVAWLVDFSVPGMGGRSHEPHWKEVARETAVQQLAPLASWQAAVLGKLGGMEI